MQPFVVNLPETDDCTVYFPIADGLSVYSRKRFYRDFFVFIIRLSLKFVTAEMGWNVLGSATR